MAEGRRLRLGLIGAGGVTVQHLPALQRLGRTELAGVVSRTRERAASVTSRYGGLPYTDTATMLDAERPDVGLICLPPHLTGAACQALIDRDIPFLTEKPIAADPETPSRLAAAIDAKGLIVAVGYQARGVDFLPQVRDRFAGSPPRMLVAYWLGATPPPAWWRHVDEGGGQVVEQATHLYDLARLLLGEATVVSAISSRHDRPAYPDSDVADATAALLRFESGALGSFANTCVSPAGNVEMSFFSEEMTTTVRLIGEWPRTSWTLTITDGSAVYSVRNARDPYEVQDEAFLDAVESGDGSRVLSSYADAVKTDRLTRAVVAATGSPG